MRQSGLFLAAAAFKGTWTCWLIAIILASALWAGGPRAGEEKAQPRTFNSQMAFKVCALVPTDLRLQRVLVGRTPSERPLVMPPCRWWCVQPLPPLDMEKVRQEVEARGIPGLMLYEEHRDAYVGFPHDLPDRMGVEVADAGLAHLAGLAGLQWVDLGWTHITDAGLANISGLRGLFSGLPVGRIQTD